MMFGVLFVIAVAFIDVLLNCPVSFVHNEQFDIGPLSWGVKLNCIVFVLLMFRSSGRFSIIIGAFVSLNTPYLIVSLSHPFLTSQIKMKAVPFSGSDNASVFEQLRLFPTANDELHMVVPLHE